MRARTLVAGTNRGVLSTVALDPAGYPFGSVATYAIDGDGRPKGLSGAGSRLRAGPKLVGDVVSLANNHVLDYGVQALQEMLPVLDEHGILHTGAGPDAESARRPAVCTRAGTAVGFLAFTVARTAQGRAKDVHPFMWIASAFFVLYFLVPFLQDTFDWI